jgi:hypothetical protein
MSGALRRVLEAACEEHDFSLGDLTVLSPRVDPYRRDTPAGHRDGQWIRDQLHRLYGARRNAHWRGLHYAITMAGGIIKPSGDVYVNNHDNWLWLSEIAAKAAKWLGYIPFDRINDERNAEPIIHRTEKETPAKGLAISISVEIPDVSNLKPYPVATGFEVRHAFHFVIFGEKSSRESIALPVAERNQADLYLPTGEISDTLIYQIACDAAADGRPLALFTLSDCDPAGWQMPEMAKIAFANMGDYMRVGPDGDPVLDFSRLARDQMAALVEVTVDDFKSGRGEDARDVRRVRFKLADKRQALVDIGKCLGLFKDKVELTGPNRGPIQIEGRLPMSDIEAVRWIGRLLTKAAAASPNSAGPDAPGAFPDS